MGAGLKKDLRVSRVGPGGSLNAFFFLLIGVISLNDRSVIKEVGVQRQPGGERSALEGRPRVSRCGRSGSENVGLSNANIGENPMPRKPKGSSARFVHGG
ncbi:hypothetical protein RJ641_000731 [Dillenia turbinata]|uniref:Uncharacterized protein n=1 Tax=Dillenia turbinata TaxID=194707 RepID=A0AAN8W6U9_9MAGN